MLLAARCYCAHPTHTTLRQHCSSPPCSHRPSATYTWQVMLDEIARPPTNELLACRESYALTAGLSLGMLALGRGSDAAGLADLLLEDKLGNYMHGKELTPQWVGGVSDPNALPPTTRSSAPPVASRCCRIREGPLVNVDVTAAGATLALALIFLKSNNASVAAQARSLASREIATHHPPPT